MSASRRLNSWIGSFNDYTKGMGVSSLWRRWAGVSVISGALGRRVSIKTHLGQLYPNLWVLLVSAPGIGKTVIVNEIRGQWAGVDHLRIAPSSTTRAGLIDAMIDAQHIDTSSGLPDVTSSLLCASVEFGNLVPAYDNAWLNILNELYDCGDMFQDKTRQHGTITIEKPHLVIIAGTQPGYLKDLLPEAAFGMGFTSRFIMAYSSDKDYVPMFTSVTRSAEIAKRLTADLQAIASIKGEYYPAPETIDLFHELESKNFAPAPEHPKLQHYSTRRPAHLLKLMMCFAASESNSLRILPKHLEQAVTLLHDTEKVMPQIFQEMATKGFADVNEELWTYVMQLWLTNGKQAIPEPRLISFLLNKVPTAHIKLTLDTMVQAGKFRVEQQLKGVQTIRAYVPLAREGLK